MLKYKPMGKLKIRKYPDKILSKKSAVVRNIGDKERQLASDMIEAMREFDGIGLAAPQVGILKRVIVVEDATSNNKGVPYIFFNPRIIKQKGRCGFCEGCLSVSGVTSDVIRPESVVMEALGPDGKEIKIETGGVLARILQHEIDHLDGILFIDRVNFFKRKKILKQISTKVCIEL